MPPSGRKAVYASGPVLRSRTIIALLALALAVPSAAFAQGAGDDQYQDPFGDEQAQNGGGGGSQSQASQDDGQGGLTDEPPVSDDNGGSGGTDDSGGSGGDEAPAEEAPETLPNTGSEPLMLAWVGLLFVLVGVGLRLRTLDPDHY